MENRPFRAADPSPIVVAGMHASATSLAASLVAGLGVDLGTRLPPADGRHPMGYFEDLDFGELQRRMMVGATRADDGGHPDWGWTESSRLDPRVLEPWRDTARALVEAREASGARWGWKNPRTSVSLDFWDPLLGPAARYLLIYRFPWEVADSLQRLGAEVFLRNPSYAYDIWLFYNRRILEFLDRNRDRCLLVSANALRSDPDRLDRLFRDRLELPASDGYTRSRLNPELLHSADGWDPLVTLLEAVRPECLDLLRELDRQADLSSAGLWGPVPRAVWSGDGGAPPRLSVLAPCYNHGELLLEAVASAERAAQQEPLELVIIDDGSDQPWTLKVLEALRGLGYTVLRQENRGVAAARNVAAAAARGDCFLPLDADNRLRPWFPGAARQALDADPEVGVVYSDRWDFGLTSGTVEVPELHLPRLLRGNYIDNCACLRRRVWEECGGWDEELPSWQDWDLWIGAAGRGWRFQHLSGVGFDYRRRPGSMVTASARAEVGVPLQERIVRKHQAVYLLHLPELLREVQDAVRETDAARRELTEIRRRLEHMEAERPHLAGRIDALEAEAARIPALQAEAARIPALEAEAARIPALEAEASRIPALEAEAARIPALEAGAGQAALRVAEIEAERDLLYQELESWRRRVAFAEGTTAWRLRLLAVGLKQAGSRLLGRRHG